MTRQPNVLFIFTDDQRFDTISALGYPGMHTPNMDRLVNMGTAFTQAHIPGGTCGAVCCPSRAMLNTGRSLFHLDDVGQKIPTEHTTMGEVFRKAGYDTFATGKWHNGKEAFNRSFADGEHIYFGGMNDHWNVPCFHYDKTGSYASTLPRCVDAWKTNEVQQVPGDHLEAGRHSSDMLADTTADWIRSREGDQSWFAYLSYLAPHDPRTMPQKYRDMFPVEEVELPPNFMGGHPYDTGALHIRDEKLESFPRTPEAIRTHIAEYRAMIAHLDDCVGRVLKAVEEKGEMDNTLIVFSGDNGLAVGQHGLMGKQSNYEHSIRVPLILAGPGVKVGHRSDTPVYLFDILPTLCEHLGMDMPTSCDGLSFAKALEGEALAPREAMYFAYAETIRSVKKGPYKLMLTVVEGRDVVTRLYNVKQDPWELNDLSKLSEHAELQDELKADLRRLAQEWDDVDSRWGRVFWDRETGND